MTNSYICIFKVNPAEIADLSADRLNDDFFARPQGFDLYHLFERTQIEVGRERGQLERKNSSHFELQPVGGGDAMAYCLCE